MVESCELRVKPQASNTALTPVPLRRKIASNMGAFFDSIHVRTDNSAAIQKALDHVAKESNCKFLLGPALNGWTSVFPSDSGQNDEICAKIAGLISDDIFHLIVHDDDVFIYCFYQNGLLTDKYNSNPNYPDEDSEGQKQEYQGHPELFQDLLGQPTTLGKFKSLLAADKFTFESERMTRFVGLLGLSNALSSYEYLQSGERDEIIGWKQFVHIPDLTAEKAAKRAAKAQIAAEKKRLQKEGILLAEIKPPAQKGPGLPTSIAWGTDSATNGLVLVWQSLHLTRTADDAEVAPEFFTIQPPWTSPLQPVGLKTNWTAYIFCMSPSGKWLAVGSAFGDWTMRVWDWRRKELAFEIRHTSAVGSVAFSQDEQWIYSLSNEFIVSSMAEKRPVVTVRGSGASKAAVHPSGKFAAVVSQQELRIVDLEKAQVIKKLCVGRRKEIIDFFTRDSGDTVIRACLEQFLESANVRQKLGVDSELQAAILRDPKAVERLSFEAQQKIASMLEKVRSASVRSYETRESLFDVCFSPAGEQLFIAGAGMRVFDWRELLLAEQDAPSPLFSVDAPRDDENDPNSWPLAYCVRFDPERNLLLSSCLAGVIQYLNVNNGQSGTLLKLPDEVSVWHFELTSDRQALCCHCSSRPKVRNLKKMVNYLQIWNYPALCKAAGLC
jgi:WD40 repeat protein